LKLQEAKALATRLIDAYVNKKPKVEDTVKIKQETEEVSVKMEDDEIKIKQENFE
jgi:hypothetical protein